MYIHIHVFRPSQDSSVWLGLTCREQVIALYILYNAITCYILLYITYIYIYIYIYFYPFLKIFQIPPSVGGNQNLLLPLLKRWVSELSQPSGQDQHNGKQTYCQLPPYSFTINFKILWQHPESFKKGTFGLVFPGNIVK